MAKKKKSELPVESKFEANTRRRNAKGAPKPRFIRQLGDRLQKQRYHKIDAKHSRPVEIYKAVMELLRVGRVGIDDAKEAMELVVSELDDVVAEGQLSWQEEGSTNWLGSDWGR